FFTFFFFFKQMNPDMVGFDFSFEQNGAANPEVHLADMNGDRLQDLVYLELSGSGICATLTVRYWPYCAIGRWGEMRVMSLATGDAFQVDHFDLRDLLVQDLTGDGLADIALLHSDGGSSSWLELRINIAGRQWSTPFTHANLPRYLPRDMFAPTTFRQADLNANGSTDLIWCNTGIENSFYWLDLLPGGKPNLLTRIDNSLGKVTEITYGNAVDDLIRARESQHPWQTWCPFPLQVVRRIRTTCGFDLDGVHDSDLGTTDQYLSEFRYRDAYFDGFEREFRGFAFAERIDYGDDVIAATNLVTSPMGDSWGEGLVRAPGWNPTNSPTGQVSSPTLVTRFRYLTGAADGRDNDEYPLGWNGALPVDEISEEGGREEEILKGRQVWEEKLDPWVLYNTDDGADFDRGCWSVFNSVNAAERVRMTPDQYVYSRIRQEWQIRRLYRPIDPALAPPGRFASASPEVGVRDGQGGSGRSVSFAFVSSVTKEIIEANGLLQIALAHPPRPPRVTAKASDYDDFGNLTLQRDFGVVAPGDYDDERFSSTEYSHGGEALHRWIIDKPARMRVTDENGVFVSETRNFYDGPAFQGLPLGTIGDRALLHRVEQIVTDSAALPALTDQSDRPGDPRLPAGSVVQKVRSQYDPFGNSIATLDPLGTPGNLAAGHARRIDYDTAFRTYPVNETIVVGGANADLVISADYDLGFGVITSSTDFNGNLTRYEYDSFARLVAIVKPLDSPAFPTATYEYSPADPNRSRVYQYDRAGNLTLSSSGSIRASSRVMTRLREVASQPGAHVMVSYTDGCGRKLAEAKESDTAGRWIISGAQSYNRRMGMQSEWLPYEIEAGADDSSPPHFGQVWPTGRPPTASLNGDPVVKTDKRADPTGREIITINPPETFTLLTNELTRARAITQILPLERRLFDENDSDPASPYHDTPMVQCLDGLGRLIKVLEVVRLNDDGTPSGTIKEWPTEYQYDLNDNLTHITDSQSNQKWFRYDGLQRKLFMNDPDRGVMIYTYDAASNLRETVDAKSQHIQYTYDGVNRLLSEDYLDALGRTPDVLYHYDVPDSNVPVGDGTYASGNNTKGMLAWAQDLSGEEHTSYDSRGRVESVIKRIPDPQFLSTLSSQPSTPLVSYRTGYAYDSLDRATTLTYPDNDQIGYAYNARNLLQKIIGGVNGLTRGGLVISNILYQPSDQLAWIDYGNGVRTTYGYDPRLRLNSLLTVSQPSTLNSQLINFTYDFDGVSNIRSISDNRPASAVPLDDPRRNTQVFAYDDLYRITRATYNSLTLNSPPSTNFISYSYDRIGNMLAQHSDIVHLEKGLSVTDLGDMSYGGSTGKSGRIGRASSASPGPHALTSLANRKSQIANREYPYDANGNMTLIDGLTNTWDFKDRLIAVENSEMRAEYTYDYADRRIIKRVAKKSSLSAGGEARGEVESVLYPDKYFEVREHDAPTKYVWNGNTRVARVTGSFTTNQRVQRFRLWPGWNLVSLAVTVTVTNALNQLRSSASLSATGEEGLGEGVLPAAVQWNSATGSWLSVIPTDALPAGTVLWINAATNCTAQVTGAYTDPLNRTAPAGASFQPGAGLEELPILGVRADIALWKFDGAIQTWRVHYATNLTSQSDFPATLAVGDGFMAPTDAPTTLEVPASELRIRYYHQDHLGSASVVTDSQGSRIADRYFYAFGHSRANANQSNITEIYTFTQKETDQESLLEYFGARFRCPGMSRFTSVDRLYENADSLDRGRLVRFLSTPQMLNLYSYCINRPVNSIDPNGLDWLKYTGTKLIWYAGNKGDTSKPLDTFKATSGIPGMQSAMFQNKKAGLASGGPLPEGSYKINLRPSPDRTAPVDSRTGEITRSKERGIEQIPEKACRTDGQCFTYGAQGTEGDWGNRRAALEPDSGNKMYGRGDFYVHDSDKGYTHGCIETESRFFSKLLEYRTTSSDTTLDVVVDYPKGNASTYGETDKNQK
ncbi:MAG TPA: hypothetical protein DCE44_04345, partial [Verrucomicrobiales bacterium]|nr:hypothetical protein [Verrucomicrobiales bacterium]